jgi:hypothetical protein
MEQGRNLPSGNDQESVSVCAKKKCSLYGVLAFCYRLERASEPNGSRAKMRSLWVLFDKSCPAQPWRLNIGLPH